MGKKPKKHHVVDSPESLADWIDKHGSSNTYMVYGHVARRYAEVWHDTMNTPGWENDPELDAEREALRFIDLEAML